MLLFLFIFAAFLVSPASLHASAIDETGCRVKAVRSSGVIDHSYFLVKVAETEGECPLTKGGLYKIFYYQDFAEIQSHDGQWHKKIKYEEWLSSLNELDLTEGRLKDL